MKKGIVFGVAAIFALGFGIFVYAQGSTGTAYMAPAYPRAENKRTRTIFIHTMEPTQTIQEGIRIVNGTDELARLLIFPADHIIGSSGGFGCEVYVDSRDDTAAWISFVDADEGGDVFVDIEPRTEKLLPFTITAPENAGVGEHNACIVMQSVNSEPITGGGLSLQFRRAIRVALLVPGEVQRDLEIRDFKVAQRENGTLVLKPTIANVGNASIDTDVVVDIRRLFNRPYVQVKDQYALFRDTVRELNLELDSPFWGGMYTATLSVAFDSDPDELGIRDESEFVTVAGPTVRLFVRPKPLALGVYISAALVLIAFISWGLLSIRRRVWIMKKWQEYTIREGDDVQSIAQTHGISWRLLVKVNKIKSPYSLKAGMRIIAPPSKRGNGSEQISD